MNAALIAGVGTLMLAMGTGVLIGRTATAGGSGSGTVQFVTVPGSLGTSSGASGSGSTATEQSGVGQAGESTGEASTGSGSAAGSSPAAKSKAKRSGKSAKSSGSSNSGSQEGSGSEKAVVKIGEAGKGPGYKKGHFTGEFFGGE